MCFLAAKDARRQNQLTELGQSIMHYLAEVRRGTEASLKIGRALIEAQKLLNHGQWLPWLSAACGGMHPRRAQRYMEKATSGWTVSEWQHVSQVTSADALADDDKCEHADDDPPRNYGRRERKKQRKKQVPKAWDASKFVKLIADHRARYRAVVEDAQAALAACHDDLSPAARAAYLRACVDFVTTELDHMNAISPPDAMAPDTDVVDAQAEPVSRPPPRLVAPRKP